MEGSEDPVVDSGGEHCPAGPVGCDGVGVGSGHAFDEATESETAQVVAHLVASTPLPNPLLQGE